MDANANGLPVTPRWGYAVEINALWFNALVFASELATLLGDDTFRLPVDTGKLAHAYRDQFWLGDSGYLADVVNEEGKDSSMRPNQIFAVSLPFSPLTRAMQDAVVDKIARELLTPYGLRTLASGDSRYRGRYTGAMVERDSAYHQGTVWPWLLGAFIEAYLRIHRNSRPALDSVRIWLRNWSVHLTEAGLGTISEVFDGDAPHRPNGCIAQAWSVGELLRAMHLFGAADKKNRWWSTRKRPTSPCRRKAGHGAGPVCG
jgi:glycogen debranching enzyme